MKNTAGVTAFLARGLRPLTVVRHSRWSWMVRQMARWGVGLSPLCGGDFAMALAAGDFPGAGSLFFGLPLGETAGPSKRTMGVGWRLPVRGGADEGWGRVVHCSVSLGVPLSGRKSRVAKRRRSKRRGI